MEIELPRIEADTIDAPSIRDETGELSRITEEFLDDLKDSPVSVSGKPAPSKRATRGSIPRTGIGPVAQPEERDGPNVEALSSTLSRTL